MILQAGDKGEDVVLLQKHLNMLGAKPQLSIDGNYGKQTVLAVKNFQKKESLPQTGSVDVATNDKITQRIKDLESWLIEPSTVTTNVSRPIIPITKVYKVVIVDNQQYIVPKKMKLRDNNPVVKYLNNCLAYLGYSVELGTIFTKSTKEAIKQFKRDMYGELFPSGDVDREEFSVIISEWIARSRSKSGITFAEQKRRERKRKERPIEPPRTEKIPPDIVPVPIEEDTGD
ncbi:MAG: peptidoglycan-binding domain-containing protein, partial [Nitrospirota bacterium]